jgi:hypothetical protein
MNPMTELIDRYLNAWNEPDGERRRELLAAAWTETGSYLDPLMSAEGHDNLDALAQGVQARFPGHRFRRVGEVDGFQDRVRFSWEFGAEGQPPMLTGVDFGVVASDGRFQQITGFFDQKVG